jgi:hypothetical protein
MKRVIFRSHEEIFELAVAHLNSQRRSVLLISQEFSGQMVYA